MTGAPVTAAPPPVCPYLGLRGDPATHLAFVSTAQVCHAGRRPVSIDAATQARDCLTDGHVRCPRYRPLVAPGTVPVTGTAVGVATSGAPTSPDAGPAGLIERRHGRRWRLVRLVLLGITIGVIGLVGVGLGARLAAMSRGDAGGPQAVAETALATTAPSPAASPAPTIEPTASPGPTPTPTPAPTGPPAPAVTARPTAAVLPTAAPSPAVRYYTVRAGDTLTAIGRRFGVTVKAIAAANHLADPSLIVVGQRLVIPSQ